VRRIGPFIAILALSMCVQGVAGGFEFSEAGRCSVAFFHNLTGHEVDGLLLRFARPAPEIYTIAVGGDMTVSSTDGSELLLSGALAAGGTCEVDWCADGYPLESAAWLLDGDVVQEIDVNAPTARLAARRGAGDLEVIFFALGSVDPDGLPLTRYVWTFDDGVVLDGYAVTRDYSNPREVTVTLTVWDAEGRSASQTRTLDVAPPRLPHEPTPIKLYVNNVGDGTSTVIDLATMLPIATIPVGSSPVKMVIVDGKLYVANRNSGTVSVIDTTTDTVITTLTTGGGSWQIGYHNGYVFVGTSSSVTVIDPAVDSVVAQIPGVSTSRGFAFVGDKGYVTSEYSNSVLVFDTLTHTPITSISVGSNPKGIVAVGEKVYVFNNGSDSVAVVDSLTDTIQTTIPVGNYPHQGALADGKLYTATSYDDALSIIDTSTDTVTAVLPMGDYPGTAYAGAGLVFVPNVHSDSVSIIDTALDTVIKTLDVTGAPHSIAIGARNAYVSLQEAGGVAVIDLATLEVTIPFIPTGTTARYMMLLYGNP